MPPAAASAIMMAIESRRPLAVAVAAPQVPRQHPHRPAALAALDAP
jgi:hypothetical protein